MGQKSYCHSAETACFISPQNTRNLGRGAGNMILFLLGFFFFNLAVSRRRVRGRLKSQQPHYKTAGSNQRCSILPNSPVGSPGTGCPSQGCPSWLRGFVHGALAQFVKDAEQYKGSVKCLMGARHTGSLGTLHNTAFCLYSSRS